MKVLITEPRAGAGSGEDAFARELFDLDQPSHIHMLMLAVGTARWDEARVDTDCNDALDVVRGLLGGTGGAVRLEAGPDVWRRAMYQPGLDVYWQGEDGGIFFVDPVPAPALFGQAGTDDGIAGT